MVAHEAVLWPIESSVVGAHFRYHLLVSLDAPPGSDIVSVDPALLALVGIEGGPDDSTQD